MSDRSTEKDVKCTCESMGGRFGAHRDECPQRIAFLTQVRAEEQAEKDANAECDCAGRLIETNAHEDTCPVMQERWNDPEYVAAWEAVNPCPHDWLDRPESDTSECLICGLEVTG